MAQSPSHKFGQLIGEVLTLAFEEPLQAFANEYGLYFDKQGRRQARGTRKIVSWLDQLGNKHDLDFVLERNGSDAEIGLPMAFIELAWRRYTKHSKNKVQEIEGSVLSLSQTYANQAPLMGAILAGEFTDSALEQLKSKGFVVLYVPYNKIMAAFSTIGFDAHYDEATTDVDMMRRVTEWENTSDSQKAIAARNLISENANIISPFFLALGRTAGKHLVQIHILPLHGSPSISDSVNGAITSLEAYEETDNPADFVRYEIQIEYSNDDFIRGQFREKSEAIDFIRRNSQYE